MVLRPATVNPFEFVTVAALRAHQLSAGSVPRCNGEHSVATMAQMEVAEGRVARAAATGIVRRPAIARI